MNEVERVERGSIFVWVRASKSVEVLKNAFNGILDLKIKKAITGYAEENERRGVKIERG